MAKTVAKKLTGLLAKVMAERSPDAMARFTPEESATIDEALDTIASGESACSLTKLARHIADEFGKPISRTALSEYARRRSNGKSK